MIVIICWLSNFKDRAFPVFHRAKQCCVDLDDECAPEVHTVTKYPIGTDVREIWVMEPY